MARRRSEIILRAWAIRGAIAVVLGLIVGFGTGATAVRVLQPPGMAPDSSADSTRNARRARIAAVQANDNTPSDSAPHAKNRIAGTLVPKLVGLEEGDARKAIERAGFTVGTVLFKSSEEAAGIVLATFPVPGESVPLPATINLVLSDGHHRKDSVTKAPPLDINLPESLNKQ